LLCVKILERKAALLGLDTPQRLDIVQVQAEAQPTSSFEKLHEMILRIGLPDGNGQAHIRTCPPIEANCAKTGAAPILMTMARVPSNHTSCTVIINDINDLADCYGRGGHFLLHLEAREFDSKIIPQPSQFHKQHQ